MSSHIIYDKQFIKVGENYLPFILSGDNNVYEVYRNRRSRDINMLCRKDNLFLHSEKDLYDYVDEFRSSLIKSYEDYNDESFGYFSAYNIGHYRSHTTFGKFRNIVKFGIQKSITFEQLKSLWSGFKIIFASYNNEFRIEANTEQEIIEYAQLAREYEVKNNSTVYCSVNISDTDILRIRKTIFNKERKRPSKTYITDIEIGNEYFKINMVGYGEFVKLTKNSTKYSYNGGGKIFRTERDAKNQLKRLNERSIRTFEIKRFIKH